MRKGKELAALAIDIHRVDGAMAFTRNSKLSSIHTVLTHRDESIISVFDGRTAVLQVRFSVIAPT